MRVMVECYHNTALVRSLGVPLRNLGHEHGKGNVLMALAKWHGKAIGVVDADPGKQNSIPGEMALYREMSAAHGIALLAHSNDTDKALIIVSPTLEDWLLDRAAVVGIRASAYGLPDTARAMHRNARYDLKPQFRRFLDDLAADAGMLTLRQWLIG